MKNIIIFRDTDQKVALAQILASAGFGIDEWHTHRTNTNATAAEIRPLIEADSRSWLFWSDINIQESGEWMAPLTDNSRDWFENHPSA